ncbi:MAG TPA: acyl-ACP thioesterase domain-containing protein [Acidimicrobiales bacterium]|nr:acyl-ACP thioesterase domain-containing protein [Acidimicrobiales bacterium]
MTAALPAPPGAEMREPGPGRVFRSARTVRLSDVDPEGRIRLDAVARYLQDVATDDVRHAGVEDAVAWVVRRTTITAGRRPVYGERLELATWCSGTGSALAERRTSVRGERGSRVETVSLWVSLDRETLRPVPLDGPHFDPYREAAGERRVRARFVVPGPPDGISEGRPWPLRASDIDLFHHVNNVIAWSAVEEEARRLAGGRPVTWGQVEYRRAMEPGETPVLTADAQDGAIGVWMLGADGTPAVCARLGGTTGGGP